MDKEIDNIVHNNLGHILTTKNTNNNFKRGLYKLKNSKNFKAKCITADKLSAILPVLNKYIYGNALPNSIDIIGVSQKNFHAENLIAEIDWFILTARKYQTELNLFLNYKRDFENSFLLGKYDDALVAIEKSETLIGYSIWSCTSKFLIHEYTNKQDRSKILQSEVLEKNKDGVFTASLINFISQRSERKLSAYRYDRDLDNTLNGIKSNLDQPNKDYYNFQLNFFENFEFKEATSIMTFDFSNSIIDRYITFRRLIIYCFSNSISLPELVVKIEYLVKRIDDDLFNTIRFLYNNKFESDYFFDSGYLKIIDLYYSGLYEEACTEIKKYIRKNEINFTLINLYSRSLVLDNKPFSAIIDNQCLVNEIAENIFKIYNRSSNPSEAIYSLYQISKNIDSFDINYQLNTYIKLEQNLSCNTKYLYFSGKKADPIIAQLFVEIQENLEDLFGEIVSKTFDSVSINYRLKLLKGDYGSIIGIANNKFEIDRAKYLYQINQYDDALILWKKIYDNNLGVPPILETAIDYIFRIFAATEKFDDSVKWYVDCAIKNPFLVYKVNAESVHKSLRKGRFKNIKINIYLPLFISLVSNDENEKSFAIELFCKSKNVKFPSDLFSLSDLDINPHTELFFYLSCNNETLKNYSHLNTTKRRLDERINICNYLATHCETNRESYLQELNLLTNELIIHEGTQKLDESKIYANDQAILNKELDEYEGLYKRYTTILGLILKNIKILTVNKNDLRYLNKKGEIEYSQNEIEYSDKSDIDAFYNLFSLIREKFLFSKFGIVTYLSTRIRHGVLLGELRPELEKNNLIFYKNKLKDKYEPNSFWSDNQKLTQEEKNKAIGIITVFSEKIDSLINTIIKENIQIKISNEYPNGWFDYDFSNEELYRHAITLYYEENYKDFCKKVLDLLWIRTDDNLDRIRLHLQDEVKTHFVNLINDFNSELHKVLGKDKMPEIFSTITSCSTNIQNKIDKIASWFKRSGKTHSNFKLNMLIDIIFKGVERAHPMKILKPTFEYNFNKILKGEFYTHFNDFIRIFIENMLKHSYGNNTKCLIQVYEESKNIIIVFTNDNVAPESEVAIEKFGNDIQVDGLKLITEGKSGLMKAIKTIKDDLGDDENDIYIHIENSTFRATVVINYTHLIV